VLRRRQLVDARIGALGDDHIPIEGRSRNYLRPCYEGLPDSRRAFVKGNSWAFKCAFD
jgi:hypothetical protein